MAEATVNAMEHGNRYQHDRPVHIQAESDGRRLLVRIRDHGGNAVIPAPQRPDIERKLAGLQSPRGWGLLLIRGMVDEMVWVHDGQTRNV